MTTDQIVRRIDALLALEVPDHMMNETHAGRQVMEMYQGTLQLLRLLHGADNAQENGLAEALASLKAQRNGASLQIYVQPVVVGTLRAMKGDLHEGMLGSISRQGAGEALADFATLAREALATGNDSSRSIAAVLTAALFEDTLRRLGSSKGGVSGRPELQAVVVALKAAGVFTGATTGVAQSFLKFRNDALHADWSEITSGVIESCLTFVQGLLIEHFS